MALVQRSRMWLKVLALTIGDGGSKIKKVKTGSVTINPASINSAAVGETSVTITGVAVGDLVQLIPPTNVDAGCVIGQPFVSATDTVKLRIANLSGGSLDIASGSWSYVWIDLT